MGRHWEGGRGGDVCKIPCILYLFDGEPLKFEIRHKSHEKGSCTCYVKDSTYLGADKSLARPPSRCILFDGGNISFNASLVIYI